MFQGHQEGIRPIQCAIKILIFLTAFWGTARTQHHVVLIRRKMVLPRHLLHDIWKRARGSCIQRHLRQDFQWASQRCILQSLVAEESIHLEGKRLQHQKQQYASGLPSYSRIQVCLSGLSVYLGPCPTS